MGKLRSFIASFLSSQEIATIKTYVPTALVHVPHLIVEFRADGMPSAFMGIDSNKLEMLFLAPEAQGTGLGRTLIEYAIANFGVNQVTVNEQNPQARGFYEHMGFHVYQRSELDEQGNPYPILHMRLL